MTRDGRLAKAVRAQERSAMLYASARLFATRGAADARTWQVWAALESKAARHFLARIVEDT